MIFVGIKGFIWWMYGFLGNLNCLLVLYIEVNMEFLLLVYVVFIKGIKRWSFVGN